MRAVSLMGLPEASSIEAPDEGLPFLGSPHVIDGIIRAYLKQVLDANADYLAGKIGADVVMERVRAAAAPYVEALNGRDDSYGKSAFHAPGKIGAYLMLFGEVADRPEDAVAEFLHWLAAQVLQVVNNAASDEAMYAEIDSLIERAAAMLLGATQPPTDDAG